MMNTKRRISQAAERATRARLGGEDGPLTAVLYLPDNGRDGYELSDNGPVRLYQAGQLDLSGDNE